MTLSREAVTDAMSDLMCGRSTSDLAMPAGPMKSYALEASCSTDVDGSREALSRLAHTWNGRVSSTRDPSLALLEVDDALFVVDVLDPRFWILHTTHQARGAQRFLKRVTWRSHTFDRCWFTSRFLTDVQTWGTARWFRADFDGGAAVGAVPAQRMSLQLAGTNVQGLFNLLLSHPDYRHAAALTAVATRIENASGSVDMLAHYNGRFIGNGDSFDTHLGFVTSTLRKYRGLVEQVEREHCIGFDASSGGGMTMTGRPLTIPFARPVVDMPRFLDTLFSCRDPFRLWAIPRRVSEDTYEAQAVDLHIGETLRLEISPRQVVVMLPRTTCGNTALRLVTNLQHRFDARLEDPTAMDVAAS